MIRIPRTQRNSHIHSCLRQELATNSTCSISDISYCYHCFQWVIGHGEWEEHCQAHINKLGSKRCGTITYCNTSIRQGHCPFCLGNASTARQRLQSWSRDHALWQHIDGHLRNCHWPMECPHPLCKTELEDGLDMRFHLIDDHGLTRTVPKNARYLGTINEVLEIDTEPVIEEVSSPAIKRKAVDDGYCLEWMPQEQLSIRSPAELTQPCTARITSSPISHTSANAISPTCLLKIPLSPDESSTPSILPWSVGGFQPYLPSPDRFSSSDETIVNQQYVDLLEKIQSSLVDEEILTSDMEQSTVNTASLQPVKESTSNCLPDEHVTSKARSTPRLRLIMKERPIKLVLSIRASGAADTKSSRSMTSMKARKQQPRKRRKYQR